MEVKVIVFYGFEIGEMLVIVFELLGRGKGSIFGELVDRFEGVSEGEREIWVGVINFCFYVEGKRFVWERDEVVERKKVKDYIIDLIKDFFIFSFLLE